MKWDERGIIVYHIILIVKRGPYRGSVGPDNPLGSPIIVGPNEIFGRDK